MPIAPVYAEPPILRSLSVASPVEVVLAVAEQARDLVPWALLAGLLNAAASFPLKRREFYEGSGQKKDNQLKDYDLREKQLQIEQKELDIRQAEQESDFREAMLQKLRSTFPTSDVSDEEAWQLIDGFVLPPLRGLGQTGINSVHPPDDPKVDGQGVSIGLVSAERIALL